MSFSSHGAVPRLVFAVTTDLSYDQRMQRICTSLAAAGFQVHLVGWQRPASVPLAAQPYTQHRLRGWFQKGKLFYLEYNLRLLAYLLTQKASLWGCADLDAALPTWARARLGGQPFAYDAHEFFTEVPEVVARPRVQRLWRWVEDFIVPRAQLCYTVGPALARLFEERHPGSTFGVVRNVPLGQVAQEAQNSLTPQKDQTQEQVVSSHEQIAQAQEQTVLSHEQIAQTQEQIVSSCEQTVQTNEQTVLSHKQIAQTQVPRPPYFLLYQGALNRGRGLAQLLDAMPQVPARLVVCGEGDCSAALREQAGRLGLLASGQVEFRGYVLPAALRAITAEATVGIMLLEHTGLSYYYSLANKFFDYVQAGIPQLCIDFPEYRALNAQYEVAELVPDLKPETLAAALHRLLPGGQPGPRYHYLAANCRRARQQWRWQQEEKVLINLYHKLLANS